MAGGIARDVSGSVRRFFLLGALAAGRPAVAVRSPASLVALFSKESACVFALLLALPAHHQAAVRAARRWRHCPFLIAAAAYIAHSGYSHESPA